MKIIDENKAYWIRGATLKKLWERKVTGADRQILARRDADGNTILSISPVILDQISGAHPWKPMILGSDDTKVQVQVYQSSTLSALDEVDAAATVAGFGDVFDLIPTKHLRLKVTTDEHGLFDSAVLELADGMPTGPRWVAFNPDEENDFSGELKEPVAILRAPRVGETSNVQLGAIAYFLDAPIRTHLLLDWACRNGKTRPALIPWQGAVS
jgi:hypothetical protein